VYACQVSDLTLLLEQVDTSREYVSQITSAPEAILLKRQRRQKRGRESVQNESLSKLLGIAVCSFGVS
jgi:hypothetical protein